MNIRQLQYFLAVAQELNFTRAAERVNIAQPPLSQQIMALEQELGVELFSRKKRRVTLTPAGLILVEHAQRVINASLAAAEAVRSSTRGAHSVIAVGAIYTAIYAFLPDTLRIFTKTAPTTEMNLQEMTISQQINALKEGVIEVGLLRGPVHERGLRSEILYREPLVVAVPAGSKYDQPGPLGIAELAAAPLIAVARGSNRSYGDRVLDIFDVRDMRPRITHEVSDMHTSVCLVAAGLGLSVVPGIMQQLQTRGVVYRPIAERTPGVSFALAWRDAPVPPLLEKFFDAAREAAAMLRMTNPGLLLEGPAASPA